MKPKVEYLRNGMEDNIAVIATKVDYLHEDVKSIKKIVQKVPGIKTRSHMNTGLIMVIIIALITLAFKALG